MTIFGIFQNIRMSIAEFRVWNKMIKRYERYAKGLDMPMVGRRTCPLCQFYKYCNKCPNFKSKFCSEYYVEIEKAAKKGEQGLFINWSKLALDELHQIRSRKEQS